MSKYVTIENAIQASDEFYFTDTTLSLEQLFALVPSIDIVICGECKFWAGHSIGNLDDWAECRWREDEATDADDFCSYGERKESE